MKFTLILTSSLLFASIMAAPAAIDSPTNSTVAADPMSGAIATASISVEGQTVSAQSSGSSSTFTVASMALPITVVSAILLL
ncbi:hypothetical protein INT47_004140 [Mucor saturninus]|uniref:Uncharacterized protein n=1 Tax=Mucor saturninus TaxID=64648 RepID=A0A8H7QM41_9FUNG|nr:hypothetical protein INT47_004140 [Mucor saturninus]